MEEISHSDSELEVKVHPRRGSISSLDLEPNFKPMFPDIEISLAMLRLEDESEPSEDDEHSVNSLDSNYLSPRSRDSKNEYELINTMEANSIGYGRNKAKGIEENSGIDVETPRGCLFIAGYPNLPNEEDILELLWLEFSKWGIVDNIKLAKTSTGVPYGFVYFQDYTCSENFLQYSEKVYINRSLLRVEDARVNRSLYVLKLPISSMEYNELYLKLKEYGGIEYLTFEDKINYLGYEGFYLIRYKEWEAAINAYKVLRCSKDWVIEWGTKIGQSGTVGDYFLVYIDGLDSSIVSKSDLIDLFSTIGDIKSINFINRGNASFGFVEFLDPLCSFQAVRCYNNTWWLNQHIHVHHYRRPSITQS
ncbi:hypothetical protein K502DRAFT_365090 [Neoconidiobolus thromboides FSU 785]|nr:hypothetical protein K502DRAFT_365090 [Neoconidiobolus thromboides FSU 785]